MTVIPILATLLVSPRLGGVVALTTCAALMIAAVVPAQIPLPDVSLGATDALVGVGVLTLGFWGGASYYERGRRTAYQQGKELRDELERTAARFRAYTENARDIVAEVADDGTILYASPGHEGLLGRPPSALLGRTEIRHVHSEDLSHVEAFFEALVQDDEPASVSARYVRPDGSLRWLDLRGRHYRNADGEGRVVIFGRDETPEREAAEEREALIDRLRDALESIETLRGIVPICAECKNVRREDGAWEKLEEYVASHSLADFSHGLCERCLSRYDV
jgi:PAS domain S-box-containing protein